MGKSLPSRFSLLVARLLITNATNGQRVSEFKRIGAAPGQHAAYRGGEAAALRCHVVLPPHDPIDGAELLAV
jgi:hypothetical protein